MNDRRSDGPIPVAHVITGLLVGGAEIALTRLLEALPRQEFPALVISLLPEGPMAERLRGLGCQVVSLDIRRGVPTPGSLLLLVRTLRQFHPQVVQGWMYHGNLAAWAGARLLPTKTPVVWNIRQTLYDIKREKPGTQLVIRAGAHLSRRVEVGAYNSELARKQHEAIGYRPVTSEVIPNGFDLGTFRPSAEARASVRQELGLQGGEIVVGLMNRLHPMKGHLTFLEAARRVLDSGMDAIFVCAGRGVTLSDPGLRASVDRLRLGDRVRLLGERTDTPRLFAGFDVACMASSWGEGFPNVVGEAMACGTPCVVTDVGDARAVIGSTGRVVPPDDPSALAGGLLELLKETGDGRRRLGEAARARVATQFSLERFAGSYATLYRALAGSAVTSDAA